MNRVFRSSSRLAVVAMVVAALLLSACQNGVKSEVEKAKLEKSFGLTLKAYKSGQFLLDGAVLSPLDLKGHFAYLQDRHRLPKTVLLVRSEDSGIRKKHLLAMARMELDYGFAVYYDQKGKLHHLVVTDKKAIPQLHHVGKSQPLPNENADNSASGPKGFPGGGGG